GAEPQSAEHEGEVPLVEHEVCRLAHGRLGIECDREPSAFHHPEVVGTVPDRDGATQGYSGIQGPFRDGIRLSLRVDDLAQHSTRQYAIARLEPVGAAVVEA